MNRHAGLERIVPAVAASLVLFFWSVTALAGVNRWTSRGPEGASILSLAIDPTRPDTLYAGTGSYAVGHHDTSIIKSVDGGRTWAPSGIGLTTGLIDQILVDPMNPDRLYARAQAGDGSVFVSTNGGALWEPLVVTLPVYCLAVGRGATQTVLYAGTARNGILKSTDAGASWNASGLDGFAFFAIFVDPTDSNRAYASGFGGDSFRTVDGGATWQRLLSVSLLAMDPAHPQTVYARGDGTIRRSTDAGDTWSPTGALTVDPLFMAVHPADGNRLYLSTFDSFWTSADGGTTWGSVDNPRYFDFVTSLAFDPRDPAVVHAGRRLTGPYRSTDHGASFQAIHHGLNLTDILAMRTGSRRGGPLYADASSCPVDRSDDGGRTWCCANPLLQGSVVAVDPVDPLTVYLSVEGTNSPLLHVSRDGGETVTPLADPNASLQQLVVVHPKDPAVLYAFLPGLFRSADGGATWTSISAGVPYAPAPAVSALAVYPPVAFDEVTTIAVDPQNPSTIYAASHHCLYSQGAPCMNEASALSRSVDAGQNWTTIPLPPGTAFLSQVSLSPADPGAIYILSSSDGAFRSRDAGASWTVVRSTLGALTLDPANASVLYGIEREGAVLRSTDGGATWLPFGEGVDGIVGAGLFVDPTGTVVRAATTGAGVQEYEFGAPEATLSTAPGEDFRISLEARDQRTGRTSAGLAVAHTDDFAWFSLPGLTGNTDNPEVFVKVVDGRAVNGNFWVFYGGLTDVEYTVSVTQESTSLLRTYSKAAGSTCGAFDTEAFARSSGPAPSAAAGASCVAESDLFLNPGRSFVVRLTATDPRTGRTTSGVAATENDSFGTFSLPAFTGNLSNPEVFVKIVDGRPVNGRFWVFYGGLTDVAYTLTVTDAVTGAAHAYEKAAGSACGGFDTATFSE